MAKIFTGDYHLFHPWIMKERGYSTIDEMHEDIVEKHNEAVHPGDVVYILGDLAVKTKALTSIYELDILLSRLHGTKLLVLGNHDEQNWDYFKEIYQRRFAKIAERLYFTHFGQKLFLSHYSHRSWRASIHGSWHLFAHSHGKLKSYGKSFDCGFDVFKRPISFDEVSNEMKKLEGFVI